MQSEEDRSLGDEATFAGAAKRRPTAEMSLGDERTLGDSRSAADTIIDDIDVVDLEARYTIQGTLGQGGMGAVLLATDTRLDRKVAIKRILGEAARSKTAIMRFLTEAKAIAALNHQNIVQIYDYGRAKDGPFLIMEYVDGGSLLDRCREGALPLKDAVDLACQLCDGLAKAHDVGIVHRDIKPANVLLNKDGLPKLTDFGLAKAEATNHGMTMTGAVMGTLDFMPPEQRKDAALTDARSDLWSLAATVYQMVTGKSPKIIKFNDVPQSLQDVLGKALEDSKDDRYQNAKEFRDALKDSLRAKSVRRTAPQAQLSAGECPKCHAGNDLTRKFCSDCAAPLRVGCLRCEAKIPVWDRVCGECGGKQPDLTAAKVAKLASQREQAEEFRQQYRFEEAIRIATALAAVEDERLAEHVPWAKQFVASTEADWKSEREAAEQKFMEAQTHRDAFDYAAAIQAMRAIPRPIQTEQMQRFDANLKTDHIESSRLLATIAEKVRRRDLRGLPLQVERAIELRGDRKDLRTLRQQLQNKQVSKSHLRDGSFEVIRNSVGILLAPAKLNNSEIAVAETDAVASAQPLLIGVFPVTQQQFEHVMQSNPSRFKGENRPVESVTFHGAETFCRALSELPAEVSAGRRYRLPTEPEWERACRAGTHTMFSFGEDAISFWDGTDDAGQEIGGTDHSFFDYGWCKDNSDRQSHPVGLKKPNAWGLFDMHGNVWEWCAGHSVESSDAKPLRGGSWQSPVDECSSAFTMALMPHLSRSMVGFRVVCDMA